MASLTLTIPAAQVNRLVRASAEYRGIDISKMTAGQKASMMKDDIIVYWKERVQASEVPAVQASAAEAARAAKLADIDANLTVS